MNVSLKIIIAAMCLTILGLIPLAQAQTTTTTEEITQIVLAWMPLIIIFAMLGMVLGMLRKFGKV